MIQYTDMYRPCLGVVYDDIDSMIEDIISIINEREQDPKENFFSQPGIIITVIIVLIPILLAIIFAMIKANNAVKTMLNKGKQAEAQKFANHIELLDSQEIEENLVRK